MVTLYNILKKLERPVLIAFGVVVMGVLLYQVGKMIVMVVEPYWINLQ